MFCVFIWVYRRRLPSRNSLLGLFGEKAELILETSRQGSKFQINKLRLCAASLDQCAVSGVSGFEGEAGVPHIEELLHQESVRVQVPPGQAAEVCVVQVEEVLGHTGSGAALAVLHQTQPQRTSLSRQQTVCNSQTHTHTHTLLIFASTAHQNTRQHL